MKSTTDQIESLKIQQEKIKKIYKPLFYRLHDPADEKKFNELITTPGLSLNDYVFDQVKEYIKFKDPSKPYSPEALEEAAKQHVGDLHKYGVWIYYPWSNRLVHTLDKEEFIDVRTSRNQNKITRQERDILGQKKIGVIGLSVGQSVSVTLAMERICGEIRLADFDTLELTNLNRIRTGIHNLGLPKVYSVAREISEIDPFINVICFPEGLTEANMDDFFMVGGKLDLLVEESDGFDIKILSRYKARELQVPVIMEASDRCAVDVERFDLHPQRSILHGIVDHLDINTLKNLKTNDEKIPYMIDMLGLETASLKLKASMLEIGQTINTWPQLASAVTMGGGITADISRRMLLNQYTQSGRFHVDIEELIGEPKQIKETETIITPMPLPAKAFFDVVTIPTQKDQVTLSKPDVEKMVTAGCQAPSGGNIQPWRWVYNNASLLLFNAFDADSSLLDHNSLLSYTSLGAASENIILQASVMGYDARTEIFPTVAGKQPVVIFRFYKTENVPDKNKTELASAIFTRLTNRKLGQRESIEQHILDKLVKTAQETNGAELHFFTGADELSAIGNLLGEIEKIKMLEKQGHSDFVNETRWTTEEAQEKRDGIDLQTLEISNTERVAMKVFKNQPVRELISAWNGGGTFKSSIKRSIDAAGAVGIITMNSDSKESRVLGGMALERVWLQANKAGISFQPVTSSVFLYNSLRTGNTENLSAQGGQKLKDLRPLFEKTFLIEINRIEIFIFRLSKASEPGVRSVRKPLDELFYFK